MGQSYGFKHALAEAVEAGAKVTVPAPGASAEDCLVKHAQVALGGDVLTGEAVKVALAKGKDDEPDSLTVTNAGEAEWPAGAELYVYTPEEPPPKPEPEPEPEGSKPKGRKG